MKVTKWVSDDEKSLYENPKPLGYSVNPKCLPLPKTVPKTDEERIQSMPLMLYNLKNKEIVITQKI